MFYAQTQPRKCSNTQQQHIEMRAYSIRANIKTINLHT